MNDRDDVFLEDLDSIASILAGGYLRYCKQRREDLLANAREADRSATPLFSHTAGHGRDESSGAAGG